MNLRTLLVLGLLVALVAGVTLISQFTAAPPKKPACALEIGSGIGRPPRDRLRGSRGGRRRWAGEGVIIGLRRYGGKAEIELQPREVGGWARPAGLPEDSQLRLPPRSHSEKRSPAAATFSPVSRKIVRKRSE